MNFNPMLEIDGIDYEVVKPHDLENVIQHLHQVIDRVKSGDYDMLQGDLIGYSHDKAKVDIINLNLRGDKWPSSTHSSLNTESLNCGSLPVAMIVHDTLLDATRVMVNPEIDEDGDTVGYAITKGYEEFTQTLLIVGLKEEVEVENVDVD